MKFKVTDRSVNSVSIEYEDGTTAVVPIFKGQTKEEIITQVANYTNDPAYDSGSDIPVNINDELETPTVVTNFDYKTAREWHYPSKGDQLDALHWAREGDDTNLKAIDVSIKLVKEKIAKGSTWTKETLPKALD